MTTHRPLRIAAFAALVTTFGCSATIDDDRVDESSSEALSGACTNLTMNIVPLRDEMRFGVSNEPNDRAALNPRIPAERICDRRSSKVGKAGVLLPDVAKKIKPPPTNGVVLTQVPG